MKFMKSLFMAKKNMFPLRRLSEDAKKRTLIINGVSKSHSMTGWRIGYIAGDAEVVTGDDRLSESLDVQPDNNIAICGA